MVVDDLGEVRDRRRVASTGAALVGALEGYGGELMKAVLEAGYGWGPIYDWLGEVADEVVLAHPTKVRAIAEARIKNDRLDSEILAHLLRADLVPEAYAPSKEIRAVKRVLRQRMFFVQFQTKVKNCIRCSAPARPRSGTRPLLVNPSPTSALPKVVSATTFAAAAAGTEISTPDKPVSTLTWASRESVPPKSSS